MKEDCSSVTKPNEIPLQVENPQISDTLAENTRLKEHLDVESHRNDVTVSICQPKEAIEKQNNVPRNSRVAKNRSRSRPKRSHSVKTCSLQEELSRTVSAVNALVTPVTVPSGAGKRPIDDSLNTVTDEWQPKEKKSKTEPFKKVLLDDGKSIVSIVRIDEIKSSVVPEFGDKNLSVCDLYPTDDLIVDTSQETVPSSHKSSEKSTQESPGVPLEKDFTPHTFNLIPASRRLKMVKKKENSNGPLLVKEQELVVSADNQETVRMFSAMLFVCNFYSFFWLY